jgi:hypothetical protein
VEESPKEKNKDFDVNKLSNKKGATLFILIAQVFLFHVSHVLFMLKGIMGDTGDGTKIRILLIVECSLCIVFFQWNSCSYRC